jgi:hypothetical protein
MPIKKLLQSQTNSIYIAVKEAGWNVAEFEWVEMESHNFLTNKSQALRHKPSDFYFIFDLYQDNRFYYSLSPSEQIIVEHGWSAIWENIMSVVKTWLKLLAREVNSPDLWSELPNDSKLIESASDDNDNSTFNAQEKEIIQKGLEEVKQYLIDAHKLDAVLIEGQLNYLTESADRLGRKDWKNILVATIFSIIIQGGIAGHSAQEIFQFVWTVLSSVLIHKLYLP